MATVDSTVAIIGGGSMGGAIGRGLVASGTVDPERLSVVDHHTERLADLAEAGVQVGADAAQVLKGSPDVVILAVKPQVISALLDEVGEAMAGSLVVSILAGTPLSALEEALGEGERVVRVMPNLPVAQRSGASAICGGLWATEEDVALVDTLFSSLGATARLREDQLDAEGAVVGCGPAYFALLVDELTRAAVHAGMPCAAARSMLVSTMEGVAKALSDGTHPRAYMDLVTSPGGTTAAALKVLEPPMAEGVFSAIDAALARTHELARGSKGDE